MVMQTHTGPCTLRAPVGGKGTDYCKSDAKNASYFVFTGANEKLIEKLTEEARERLAVAISTFTAITDQLVKGKIKINLLKFLLERRHAFLALLRIGNCYIIFYNIFYKHEIRVI